MRLIKNEYEISGEITRIIMRTSKTVMIATIDTEDINRAKVFNWYTAKNGSRFYAVAAISYFMDGKIRQSPIKLHRLIKSFPDSLVDHKNGDTLDNRKINLREATKTENNRNRSYSLKTITGYKGVYDKKCGNKRYQVLIRFNNSRVSVGYYSCPHEAAIAYNKKASELHGEFFKPNIIRKYGLDKKEG